MRNPRPGKWGTLASLRRWQPGLRALLPANVGHGMLTTREPSTGRIPIAAAVSLRPLSADRA
jgi:hypothetical protein